ncbi:MAG: BirA family transcriptional regulator [Candidatus Hydrogenedentes bacterium]|nr:BirA family transcriptional regulator [Candidatus Hydrogenedentota bacterium]
MCEAVPGPIWLDLGLKTALIGAEIRFFEAVESTNAYALDHGVEGMVVVADRQTAGRGRHGRAWHSAAGLGLWFSVAFTEPLDGLVFAGALAVRDALTPRCLATVKWPNDILIGGKKVCGILVEQRGLRMALGIGINVRHRPEDFPEDLRDSSTSLEWATGQPWDANALLSNVLEQLDRQVVRLKNGHYEDVRIEWADACEIVGKKVRCGSISGVVTELDAQGAVWVAADDGPRRIVDGTLILSNGE